MGNIYFFTTLVFSLISGSSLSYHEGRLLTLIEHFLRHWFSLTITAVVLLAAGLLTATSCSSLPDTRRFPPRIEGAQFVGNERCADCHQDIVRHYPDSVHSRFFPENATGTEASGCESCHGAGSLHVQAPEARPPLILNPGKDPQACLDCHTRQHGDFRLPQHHPVLEGRMNCVDCHDPHGREIFKQADGLALARQDQQCISCHRDQSRHFVFTHEAMQDGCTTCHQPHGSIHEKLLTQRDSHLCLRCHAQMQFESSALLIGKTDHQSFLQLGTCWTAGCHTAVHGSMINSKLLY